MRKYSLVLSAVAVTGLTVSAFGAAESTYWFDVRPNTGAAGTVGNIISPGAPFTIGQGDFPNDGGAGGGKGNGQVLRISPVLSGGQHLGTQYPNFDADNNSATGDLWLYTDVLPNADSPLGTNDVISSIGLDMAIATSAASPRFEIATVAWTWTYADANTNFGKSDGTSSRTGVVGAKFVKVPVSPASAYATAGGLTPTAMYQLGKLRITGAARNAVACGDTGVAATHANNSTYNVTMSINNLLITRTFSTGGNATPEERVSLGYFGGALDADVSGNTVGGAGNRDAIIQVRLKHDGNGSGIASPLDIGGANGFNAAVTASSAGTLTQRQRYLFDRQNDGLVNPLDIGSSTGFNALVATTCP